VPSLKNDWSYNSTPQYAFTAWCSLKKQRDNFTFTVMSTPAKTWNSFHHYVQRLFIHLHRMAFSHFLFFLRTVDLVITSLP